MQFSGLTNGITGVYTPNITGWRKRRPQHDWTYEQVYKGPVHPLVRHLRVIFIGKAMSKNCSSSEIEYIILYFPFMTYEYQGRFIFDIFWIISSYSSAVHSLQKPGLSNNSNERSTHKSTNSSSHLFEIWRLRSFFTRWGSFFSTKWLITVSWRRRFMK